MFDDTRARPEPVPLRPFATGAERSGRDRARSNPCTHSSSRPPETLISPGSHGVRLPISRSGLLHLITCSFAIYSTRARHQLPDLATSLGHFDSIKPPSLILFTPPGFLGRGGLNERPRFKPGFASRSVARYVTACWEDDTPLLFLFHPLSPCSASVHGWLERFFDDPRDGRLRLDLSLLLFLIAGSGSFDWFSAMSHLWQDSCFLVLSLVSDTRSRLFLYRGITIRCYT